MKTTIEGDVEVTEHEDYEGMVGPDIEALRALKADIMDRAPHGMFAVLRHSSGHTAVTMELNHLVLTVMDTDVAVAVANFRALWDLYKTLPKCMGSQPVAHA